jgi:hypothetical protein
MNGLGSGGAKFLASFFLGKRHRLNLFQFRPLLARRYITGKNTVTPVKNTPLRIVELLFQTCSEEETLASQVRTQTRNSQPHPLRTLPQGGRQSTGIQCSKLLSNVH